jgi:molecular chaperone GrpE
MSEQEKDILEDEADTLDSKENTKADVSEDSEFSTESKDSEKEDPIKSAADKYLRLHAEFENFRKRTTREKLDIIESANANLLERLVDVKENFDRAFSQEHQSDDLDTFKKGILLINDQFNRILKDFGLEEVDPTGKDFDPNQHEAFLQQPSEEVPEDCVITVFQKGYKLRNKTIKTAKVIVSSGPAA